MKKNKFKENQIVYICGSNETDEYFDGHIWNDSRSYFKIGAKVKIIRHPRSSFFVKEYGNDIRKLKRKPISIFSSVIFISLSSVSDLFNPNIFNY